MLTRVFVLCFMFVPTESAWCQIYPTRPFKVKIASGNERIRGLLVVATDSLVIIQLKSLTMDRISYHDMDRIYVRRKGSMGRGTARGFAWGTGVGLVVGALIASGNNDEDSFFSDSESIVMAGVCGAMIGSSIGLANGTTWKRFEVRRAQHLYAIFLSSFKGMNDKLKPPALWLPGM